MTMIRTICTCKFLRLSCLPIVYIEGRRVARPSLTELELAVLISVGLQLNSVIPFFKADIIRRLADFRNKREREPP